MCAAILAVAANLLTLSEVHAKRRQRMQKPTMESGVLSMQHQAAAAIASEDKDIERGDVQAGSSHVTHAHAQADDYVRLSDAAR